MKYTHIYTGTDGKSHFKDLEMPLKEMHTGRLSTEAMKAVSISFRDNSQYESNYHNAPRRQFLITIGGEVEITAGGTTRRFGAGEILLADDTTGQGHITQIVDGTTWRVIVVPIDYDLPGLPER